MLFWPLGLETTTAGSQHLLQNEKKKKLRETNQIHQKKGTLTTKGKKRLRKMKTRSVPDSGAVPAAWPPINKCNAYNSPLLIHSI